MSLRRFNPRRDANEPAIVDALEAVGAEVWRVSGKGLPDLLARFRDRLYGFEVKTAKGKRTQAQEQSRWPVVRTADDALNAIGVKL